MELNQCTCLEELWLQTDGGNTVWLAFRSHVQDDRCAGEVIVAQSSAVHLNHGLGATKRQALEHNVCVERLASHKHAQSLGVARLAQSQNIVTWLLGLAGVLKHDL